MCDKRFFDLRWPADCGSLVASVGMMDSTEFLTWMALRNTRRVHGEPTSCVLRGRARHPKMQKPAQCKHKRERSRARRTVRCVPRAIMIARRAHRDRETRARERTHIARSAREQCEALGGGTEVFTGNAHRALGSGQWRRARWKEHVDAEVPACSMERGWSAIWVRLRTQQRLLGRSRRSGRCRQGS